LLSFGLHHLRLSRKSKFSRSFECLGKRTGYHRGMNLLINFSNGEGLRVRRGI
jgi:hypothetical protein